MSKPRIAITIIYNGLHHLQHKGFTDFMVKNFNLWVIIEGKAENGGSTSWCKSIRMPYKSQDGTVEYCQQLAADNNNVLFYSHHKHYKSKDEQFNKGVVIAKTRYNNAWLWQVDADEQWSLQDIEDAERILWRAQTNAADFQFNHFVKHDIVARGDWGDGWVTRLWKWRGELFDTHEPAVMAGQKEPIRMPYKFNHYSMVFEQDVRFKSRFYRGHEPVYANWQKLDDIELPCHISALFGHHNKIGNSKTYLYQWDANADQNAQGAVKDELRPKLHHKRYRLRSDRVQESAEVRR